MFCNVMNISKAISYLQSKLTSKSESTVKKEDCPSKAVMDITPQSAKEKSCKTKATLDNAQAEVHRLKDENSSLKEQLQSLWHK